MIKNITIGEALYGVIHTADILNYDEPMPLPKESNISKLEICLEMPFTRFGGKYLYRTLSHRTAVLFYTIIKNHPLENGNKRTAVIVTMLFLFVNKKTLTASADEFYNVACRVAESPASQSAIQIKILKKVFEKYTKNI